MRRSGGEFLVVLVTDIVEKENVKLNKEKLSASAK